MQPSKNLCSNGVSESRAASIPGAIDARAKLGMLAVYSASIFFIGSWVAVGAFAVMLAIAMLASHVSIRRSLTLCIPVYVICAMTVLFNVFQYHDGLVAPTLDGLLRGCFYSARILLLVLASLVLCLTVSPTRLTRAFCSMMRPLARLHVPVEDIAMVLSISLRFIPIVYDEFFRIRDSQWSRGASFDEGPALGRVRAHASIFVPLIAGLFVSAERLSKAMDVRGYGLSPSGRTYVRDARMSAFSWLALIGSSALMIAVVFLI